MDEQELGLDSIASPCGPPARVPKTHTRAKVGGVSIGGDLTSRSVGGRGQSTEITTAHLSVAVYTFKIGVPIGLDARWGAGTGAGRPIQGLGFGNWC